MTDRVVLVTGGTGFVGSHVAVELMESGDSVILLDNLSNSSRRAVAAIAEITGTAPMFCEVDLLDPVATEKVFRDHAIDAVVHCAGLKAVAESIEQPLRYWQNNVGGTINLLDTMERTGVTDLVFSSSATIYGDAAQMPILESAERGAVNPYGQTKLTIEQLLEQAASVPGRFRFVSLRYFNPVGAHPSGLIGEAPQGTPNNLMPRVLDVALGRSEALTVYGRDYPTADGTGVRDYIHVVDLAAGHRAALDAIDDLPPFFACNLGTGRGLSVLEVVAGVEAVSGRSVPLLDQPRRAGDVAVSTAGVALAAERLDWSADRDLADICRDAWRWASSHPDGYGA